MDNQLKAAFDTISSPYCQPLPDHPAVNVVIQDSGVQLKKSTGNEQQKLASQRPRGTRIDDSGTRIQVRGGRNYTSRKLFISREEMFDDVVVRGLRADGLSTKLGVKNHKDGIQKLISELFQGDSRLPIVEEHFRTHRQKSNCAKTMFATMTHEELQFLKAETFPSRIDVQVRDYLTNTFSDQPQKLQATVEVLGQVQQIFKALTPHTDFLSSHNFQTRGFFLDIVLMTCSFLMQIIQDSDGSPESSNLDVEPKPSQMHRNIFPNAETRNEEKNKTAAEILLSVGSDILDSSEKTAKPSLRVENTSQMAKQSRIVNLPEGSSDSTPTTIVVESSDKPQDVEGEEWTTVEMVDGNGNSKYVLIRANDEEETLDTMKIFNLLQSQGVNLDEKLGVTLECEDNNSDRNLRLTVKDSLKTGLGEGLEIAIDSGLAEHEDMRPSSCDATESGTVSSDSRASKDNSRFDEGMASCATLHASDKHSSESGIMRESGKRALSQSSLRVTRKKSRLDANP